MRDYFSDGAASGLCERYGKDGETLGSKQSRASEADRDWRYESRTKWTRDPLSQGRTDHLSNILTPALNFQLAVTYLQFLILACFSTTVQYHNWFPNFTSTSQSINCIFCPVTGNFDLDLDLRTWPKECQVEPSRQISRSKFTSFESYCPDAQSRADPIESSTWTTKGAVKRSIVTTVIGWKECSVVLNLLWFICVCVWLEILANSHILFYCYINNSWIS